MMEKFVILATAQVTFWPFRSMVSSPMLVWAASSTLLICMSS